MDTCLALGRRRELRKNETDAEEALWRLLRARQLSGLKFRRQHSVGPYVLDFYCPISGIAVELDGGQHFTVDGHTRDERRTAYLHERGVRVIRFSNRDLFEELDGVLEAIKRACGR